MIGTKGLRTGVTLLYAMLWLGGVISYLFLGAAPADTEWAAPAFLGVAMVRVFMSVPPSEWIMLMAVGIAAFVAELLGVYTGFPFGTYSYTDVLYPQLAGVPVPIACAWIILFAYVHRMLAGRIRSSRWFPFVGAVWMVALDLLIDPLAAGPLGYWRWQHAGLYCGIPVTNFLGWFLVSLVLFASARRIPRPGGASIWIGLSVVAFFTVIAFGRAVWPAAFVGVGLGAAHFSWELLRRSEDNGQSG